MTRARPRLEALEERLTPTTFGNPWPDPLHLTVSFAPDGAQVGASTSQLFQLLGPSQAPAWQTEVLRAFQAWASQANIDLSVVAADGSPLGASGALQGDPRFGDLRIAAAPLGPGSLAFAAPFDPLAGTWSGDLILNSQDPFTIGGGNGSYDLFSVVLHEAGHVLGLPGQTADPSSALFEYYAGVRSGPSAADVAALQSLYGAPSSVFQTTLGVPLGGASVSTTAVDPPFVSTALQQYRDQLAQPQMVGASAPVPLSVEGGLTQGEADLFSYQTTHAAPGFTVVLRTAGESLLGGRLTVLDEAGRVVQSVAAADPFTGALTVRVAGARPDERYFFRVDSAAGGVFGVGRYSLQVLPDNPAKLAPFARAMARHSQPARGHGLNDAVTLNPTGADGPLSFDAQGSLAAGGVNVYRLRSGRLAHGQTESLTVLVWAGDGVWTPSVTVYDAAGRPVQAAVSRTAGGYVQVQIDNVGSQKTFYVAVGGARGPERYGLSAAFVDPITVPAVEENGTVTDAAPQDFRSVVLPLPQLLYLQFDASSATPGDSAVEVALYDSNGQILFDQVVTSGQTATLNLLLMAGSYTLRFSGGTAAGGPGLALSYQVSAATLGDPIGPPLINPDQPPPPRDVEPTWLSNGLLKIFALLDPYGRPYGTPPPGA
jgi:hypothetical protein